MAQTATATKPTKSTARNRANGAGIPELTPMQQAAEAMKRVAEATKKLGACAKEAAEKAAPHQTELAEAKKVLEVLANGILKPEFGTAKTMKLGGGTLGWKLGAKTLVMPEFEDKKKAAKSAENFMAILEKHLPEAIERKVNQKTVVDSWEATPKMATALLKQGFKTDQKDNFFVTAPKL